MRNRITMEKTREEEEEEDKEEALEAEAEVEEEMTTRKTEELNPPEQAEVATEEMRGEETYMMITRATQEDMEAEKTPGEGDMKMKECMKNTVTETMIEAKRKTETEDITRIETEVVGEVVPIGTEAARVNEVVARRLQAIGGLPQAYPWLQGTS